MAGEFSRQVEPGREGRAAFHGYRERSGLRYARRKYTRSVFREHWGRALSFHNDNATVYALSERF